MMDDGRGNDPVVACETANRCYRDVVGWPTAVRAGPAAVYLSVPDSMAGIDVVAPFAARAHELVTAQGLAGPVIGCPDGRRVFLVRCAHAPGRPAGPPFNPEVTHLGAGCLVYLPPTRYPSGPGQPLAWLREPEPGMMLPDCGAVVAVIREITR